MIHLLYKAQCENTNDSLQPQKQLSDFCAWTHQSFDLYASVSVLKYSQ